jgi:hypothetical protein
MPDRLLVGVLLRGWQASLNDIGAVSWQGGASFCARNTQPWACAAAPPFDTAFWFIRMD